MITGPFVTGFLATCRACQHFSRIRLQITSSSNRMKRGLVGGADDEGASFGSCECTFTELEHENWQRGVDAYDSGFGPLTSQAIPTLLQKAGFPPPSRAAAAGGGGPSNNQNAKRSFSFLDVATGPGYVISEAISTAAEFAQSSSSSNADETAISYTALDFSTNFLNLAKERLERQHPDVALANSVTFVEASAEAMPFDDETFDSITCNFGILHLANPDDFLAESYRCLKPGGRLGFTVWSAPPKTEAFDIILTALSQKGNPNVPLPEGPPFFRFSEPQETTRSLKAMGFVDIDITELTYMTWDNIRDSDHLYSIFLHGTGRTQSLLRGQTSEQTDAIKKDLEHRFQKLITRSGGARRRPLQMPAIVSSGAKPYK